MDAMDQGKGTVPDSIARRRSTRMDGMIALAAFGIFAVLWTAFGIALVVSQGSLDAAWAWLQGLPTVLQIVVGLAVLPVTAGLWAWESAWPLAVRLALVGGLAAATLYVFFPRTFLGGRM
jgi:hypothetical protein